MMKKEMLGILMDHDVLSTLKRYLEPIDNKVIISPAITMLLFVFMDEICPPSAGVAPPQHGLDPVEESMPSWAATLFEGRSGCGHELPLEGDATPFRQCVHVEHGR